MTDQDSNKTIVIEASPKFLSVIPAEPRPTSEVSELSALASAPEKRKELSCKKLLVGDTRLRAQAEAQEVLGKIMTNTQVLAVFGTDALKAVNQLNDRMLDERPPVNIPELKEAMKELSRSMRGLSKKYDPKDAKVLKRYEDTKNKVLSIFRFGKTFLQEFLVDIESTQKVFDRVINTLEGKQYKLLKNVTYYDEFYMLNEQEICNLIYKIGVMEIISDMAAEKARQIQIGDSGMGDRGEEERARILELVTLLENKIIAFKGRLWVAWAMAPQIRNMRAISVGLSGRIDQTISITIPTMKDTIVIWLTLSEAEQAEKFNKAVEDAFNDSLKSFAEAAKVLVPTMANALATPALDPQTIAAMADSIAAQADGIVLALEEGERKRTELENAMVEGKQVIDTATQLVNEKKLEHVLAAAKLDPPLEIAKSVPVVPAQQ